MGEAVGVLKGVPFQKILVCVMKYGISAYGGDHVESGDEPYKRFRLRKESGNVFCALLCLLYKYPLDLLRVRGEAPAYGYQEGHPFFRHAVVRQDALGKPAVRYYDHVVRKHPDPCGAPTYVFHVSFLPCFQLYKISDPQRFFHEDVYSGKEVRQGVLKCQGYGKSTDAEGGYQRSYRDSEAAKNYEEADDQD